MTKKFILDLHEFVRCPNCGKEVELLTDNTYFKQGREKSQSNSLPPSQHLEYSESPSLNEGEQGLQP